MNIGERKNLEAFGTKRLGKLPGSRSLYAGLTHEAKLAVTALTAAIKADRERRNIPWTPNDDPDIPSADEDVDKLFEKLAKAGLNLKQVRPEGEKPKLPELWKNPITGQPLGVPKSPDERAILAKRDPELLAMLDELEKRPYAVVQRLREAEEKFKQLSEATYDEGTHAVNPFRPGGTLAAQNEVIRTSAPELVEFYKREAKPIDFEIFGPNANQTTLGNVARECGDYDFKRLIKPAQKIYEQLQAQDKADAQRQIEQAQTTIRRLEGATI